jgi:hypothetical protein
MSLQSSPQVESQCKIFGWLISWICIFAASNLANADDRVDATKTVTSSPQSLEQLKALGRSRSRFMISGASKRELKKTPEPKLAEFQAKIAPILKD